MKKSFLIVVIFFVSFFSNAQNEIVFATMDETDALYYLSNFPGQIKILNKKNNVAAVSIEEQLTHIIRQDVTTHGSKYIFAPTKERALELIEMPTEANRSLNFSISETAFVNECLDLVDVENIEDNIILLQNYGTRYHTKPEAEQAVLDQKARWDAWIAASGRDDIETRIVTHINTPMPSVVLTINGADFPEEFVIVGGHIDSTSWNNNDAPGADDNASGISSLNEMVRILIEKEYVPARTVEVMAFAAEEIGLVGSAEIAAEYAASGINVLGYVQFDMTGYNGSADDVYIMNDWYTSSELNDFLTQLMDHYNSTGIHSFSYDFSQCGYGCSDHASWASNGFHASMPFEAAIGEDNPFIHTPNDTFSILENGEHAAKFTKLALEFVIETAKTSSMGIADKDIDVQFYIRDRSLYYNLPHHHQIQKINIFSMSGQNILEIDPELNVNTVDLQQLSSGVYLVAFDFSNGYKSLKRVVLH